MTVIDTVRCVIDSPVTAAVAQPVLMTLLDGGQAVTNAGVKHAGSHCRRQRPQRAMAQMSRRVEAHVPAWDSTTLLMTPR
jgi:hypothetical protein